MLGGGRRATGLATLAAMVALGVLVAWDRPDPEVLATAGEEMDCQFAIYASNTLSFDVWVDLYDSQVTIRQGFGVFGVRTHQLKIQNHRIRSGQRMDRRYTSWGRCDSPRTWWIKVRRGSAQKTVEIKTSGTSSTSRTVDLGPSSRWEPID